MRERQNKKEKMDFNKLIEARNNAHSFRNHLGIKVTELKEGYVVCEMEVKPEFENQTHSVAGGCLYTLADSAAGTICASYGHVAPTVNADFHYLNSAQHCTKLYAYGKEVKHGKRMSVIEVEIKNQDDELLSLGVFTFAFLDKELDYIQ